MNEGPVRRRLLKRATVRKLGLGALAVIVLVLLAGGGVWWMKHRAGQVDKAAEAAAQREAHVLAQAVGGVIRKDAHKLEMLSKDPGVVAALKGGDAASRAAMADALAGQFDSVLKLRLLPPDVNQVDNSTTPPLTYASLDMINRARETGKNVPDEVHLFGSPAQYLAVLRRVVDQNGKLIGFLHLSMDVSILQKSLAKAPFQAGYAEVRQAVPKGKPLVLAKRGDAALTNQGEPVTVRVPGSIWTVAYWQGAAPAADGSAKPSRRAASGGLPWVVVLGGGLLVVLVGAGVLLALRRRKGDELAGAAAGTVVYNGAVRSIMEGAHPGLERLVPGLPSTAPAGGGAQALPSEALEHGEDITTMAPFPQEPSAPAAEADLDTLEFDITQEPAPRPPARPEEKEPVMPASIFRAYDIRGIVDETLTEEVVRDIGRSIGSEAAARKQQAVVVGRDGRKSSPKLAEVLIKGLQESGRDVIDIGMVPTPVLYFATHFLDTGSGVMLTGSHNPPNYNGLKIVLGGETLAGEAIAGLRERIERGDLTSGSGNVHTAEIGPEYIRRITEDIPVALGNGLKIVVDSGNGVTGQLAPQLLRALGHDVIELYCEIDGNFPNHHPDPSQPDNLKDLIETVEREKADLGLAFDGDGDRLGVVDGSGNIIWPDRQMMLFAADVLSRNPGAQIIFDVKCSRHLKDLIGAKGGVPVMSKTGHSLIKAKMKETGALLAGEMSGHIFFKERWYGFDDALYAAARLVEILTTQERPAAEIFEELPGGIATPELRLDMPESEHAAFMQRLLETARFEGGEVSTVDGLRVDFADAWGLIRASNTTPCLVLRFEGDDAEALARVQEQFRAALLAVDPDCKLPF